MGCAALGHAPDLLARTTYETNPIGRENPVLHSQILSLAASGRKDEAVAALAQHIENNKAIIEA